MNRPPIYFHIGAPKTGTTFLQAMLWRERRRLRANGLLYPGRDRDAHFAACLDLRGARFLGHRPSKTIGAWPDLVGEIRDWGGAAIIDHELFSRVAGDTMSRAMDDLSFGEVHVVYTVRDIARQLPATWQERMKNRDVTSYGEFLRRVRFADPPLKTFWRLHDVPRILERWAQHVPAERMHVITLPQAGQRPGALWRRFATTVGIDPDGYDTSRATPNESLGAVDAAWLRRFNEELVDYDVWFPLHSFLVKQRLAPVLAKRRTARIGLPRDVYDWAVEWAHDEIAAIRAAGYHVVGDLDELLPAPFVPGADPDKVELSPAAVRALRGLAGAIKLASRRKPS
jgi:hypothetical protein